MRKNSTPSVELNSMYNWHIKRIPLDFKCLIWQAKKVTVRYIHRVTLNYKKFLSVIPTYVNANDYFCLKNIPKSCITEKKNVFITTISYLSCIHFRQKEVQIVQSVYSNDHAFWHHFISRKFNKTLTKILFHTKNQDLWSYSRIRDVFPAAVAT